MKAAGERLHFIVLHVPQAATHRHWIRSAFGLVQFNDIRVNASSKDETRKSDVATCRRHPLQKRKKKNRTTCTRRPLGEVTRGQAEGCVCERDYEWGGTVREGVRERGRKTGV
jgi:hypothetical protein